MVFNGWLKTAAACVAVAATVAGCGSSDSSSGGATTSKSAASGSGTNTGAAKAALAKYSGKPTAFPVDAPLKQRPTGKTFAYLQCSTPVCGLFAQIIAPTQKLLGYKLKVVKAGPSANEAQTAMNSIVSLKPDGLILPAADPNQFLRQLQQLQKAGVPISADGIVDPDKYGLKVDFINNETQELGGKLMADWAVAEGGGEVVFYGVPELSFSPLVQNAFDKEMAAMCSSCKVRHVDIPVGAIGKNAPSLVVSDLQSHPNTKAAAFATGEAGTGLPAALKAAQLKVKLIGGGPPPAVLGYIKQGQWDAAIGVDIYTMIWAQVDALARMAAGEPVTAGESRGLPPVQVLTKSDITFDPSKGWQGYPDFAQRFAKLWGAGQ
jgi:ribose transport system substrate-binding protein